MVIIKPPRKPCPPDTPPSIPSPHRCPVSTTAWNHFPIRRLGLVGMGRRGNLKEQNGGGMGWGSGQMLELDSTRVTTHGSRRARLASGLSARVDSLCPSVCSQPLQQQRCAFFDDHTHPVPIPCAHRHTYMHTFLHAPTVMCTRTYPHL